MLGSAPQCQLYLTSGFFAVSRGDAGAGVGSIIGGDAFYMSGDTGWHFVRSAFLVAASGGWTDVYVDEVHRYTASGVDLKQQAGAGFDAVRLAGTIPFVGSNGTTAEFDQLMLTDPGPLDAGRRRRVVTLG
jgi:hypothetical protein